MESEDIKTSLCQIVCVCVYQSSEMAQYIQTKRDLGCKAPQITVLEEGINTENRSAKEFWSLLGGKTEYRGTGTYKTTYPGPAQMLR